MNGMVGRRTGYRAWGTKDSAGKNIEEVYDLEGAGKTGKLWQVR